MRMIKRSRRLSAGVGLIELMIGIAIGLVLIAGLASVYVNSVQGGRTTTQANQLNQEMRALMDIMVNDIRRAGYRDGGVTDATTNPFNAAGNRPQIVGGECIQYTYDANVNGAVDDIDHFGFRRVGNVVQATRSVGGSVANCAGGPWVDLTDSVSTAVTTLAFDMVGSKCFAFQPANPAASSPWTVTAGTVVCDAAAGGAPSPYPDPTTHAFIETRQVNITLIANSVSDPTRSVTLRESVLIRTNRVQNPL